MARNDRAKEFERQQKEAAKARREAKRNSNDPKDWGTLRQIRESYKMTRELDPKLDLIVFGSWIGITVLGLLYGIFISPRTWGWAWGLVMGLLLGASVAMLLFTQRTKQATYKKYDGQPGAGEVALSLLSKRKYSYETAIVFNRQMDSVHRVVGRSGIVLIGDGNPGRVKPMLDTQVRRHEQVLYGIPVHTMQIGSEEGQIPLNKVKREIEKLPKSLDKLEVAEAKSRLNALDSMNQRMSLPKGPMPTHMKGMRRAMRGR